MEINEQHKIIKRSGVDVVRINLELVSALAARLDAYCLQHNETKRDVISNALMIWLNKRESGEW